MSPLDAFKQLHDEISGIVSATPGVSVDEPTKGCGNVSVNQWNLSYILSGAQGNELHIHFLEPGVSVVERQAELVLTWTNGEWLEHGTINGGVPYKSPGLARIMVAKVFQQAGAALVKPTKADSLHEQAMRVLEEAMLSPGYAVASKTPKEVIAYLKKNAFISKRANQFVATESAKKAANALALPRKSSAPSR